MDKRKRLQIELSRQERKPVEKLLSGGVQPVRVVIRALVLTCISHRRIVDVGELGSGNSWKGRLFCVITTLSKRGSGCGKGGLSYDRV